MSFFSIMTQLVVSFAAPGLLIERLPVYYKQRDAGDITLHNPTSLAVADCHPNTAIDSKRNTTMHHQHNFA